MAQGRKGAIAIRSGASRQGPEARRGLRGACSAFHLPVPGRTDSDFAAVRPVQKTQFTVKVWLLLTWAPGVWTATVLAPVVASAPIVIVAVIVVEFTTVTPLRVTLGPAGASVTVVPLAVKLVPEKVTPTAVPRAPELGLIDASVGAPGLTTVKT